MRVVRMMVSKRMAFLILELLWSGISIAVYTGLLVPIMSSTIPGDDS
jgi:hypothetical protein